MVLIRKNKRMLRSESIHRIIEMALKKAKYQDRVADLLPQIAQNWCLCTYCKVYDPDNRNYRGWRKELIAHIGTLNSLPVKSDKEKWTREEVINTNEYNNVDVIRRACDFKLNDEDDIDFTQVIRKELYRDCAENAETMVSLVSSDTLPSERLYKIFPIKTDRF